MRYTLTPHRFWLHVKRSSGLFCSKEKTECWLYVPPRKGVQKTKTGYLKAWLSGKNVDAHRVSYILTRGFIPAGLLVCHTCDHRNCVRPSHLFAGTHADNGRDMQEKGRSAKGEDHGMSFLADEQILAIRYAHAAGSTQALLAEQFGVRQAHISRIVRGDCQGHLGGPLTRHWNRKKVL